METSKLPLTVLSLTEKEAEKNMLQQSDVFP